MGAQKKSTSKQLAPGTFPNRLDQLIRHRGLQKAKVAEALDVSTTTLSYYITGRRTVPHDLRSKFADLLKCSVDELFPPLYAIETRDNALLARKEDSVLPSTSFSPQESLPNPFQEISSPGLVDMPSPQALMPTRRQLLHHLLMLGSTALVLAPSALLPLDGHQRISLSIVEELEMITASYWRLCANSSLDLLGNLSEHFRTVADLLQRSHSQTMTQRLCSLSGEVAQMLGKTLFDLHEYTLAWSYYMFSLKAAQTASNHDLWAAGIGRMMLLLLYWKHPQQALPLLQEVRQLTIQNTLIACWLAVVEAEVHAALGERDACDVALTTAKNLSKNTLLGDDRYATGLSASRIAGYEGACFVRLHQPDRALPALQQAFTLLDSQSLRRQSTLLTDMGIAYAQQGNIQQASHLAAQALSLTQQTKSRSVLERVRTICMELEQQKAADAANDLEQQVNTTMTLITL